MTDGEREIIRALSREVRASTRQVRLLIRRLDERSAEPKPKRRTIIQ